MRWLRALQAEQGQALERQRAELEQRANRLAAKFRELGLDPGQI